MVPLRIAHLVVLALWAGVVIAEIVLELTARDADARRHAANVHYWIDLTVELPLLLAVLATGGLLVLRSWPPSTILVVKIAAGLVAGVANLVCVGVVIRRRNRARTADELEKHGRWVMTTAVVGVPFGLVAAYLGSGYLSP